MAAVEIEVSRPGPAAAPEQETPARRIAQLYESHYGKIRALCQTILRDPVDADDAAQQTFLSAFSSLIGGTVPTDAGAWLTTIARRECWARAAQRRRRPLELDQTNEPASRTGKPLEEAIRNADVSAIWQAINALPRQQRAAILTREVSGLTYEEAAQALGVSESAVESLLVRARRQLRKRLEPVATATNVALTPLLLLRHRLARLLSIRLSAKAAIAPAVVKVGAVTAGAVVVAGSVSLGAHTLRHHPFRSGPPTASASELVRATSSQTRLPRTAEHGLLARRLAAAERQQRDPTTHPKTSSGQSGGAPSVGTGATAGTPAQPTSSGDGAGTTAQTPIDRTPASATPPDSPAAVGTEPDTTPTETTAAEAAPTETVPTETVPTDTTPADSPPDPLPTDPAPTNDGSSP